jgi:hypothetical protein
LEWACAYARVSGANEGHAASDDVQGGVGVGDESDDESEEAITPRSSHGGSDSQWYSALGHRAESLDGNTDGDVVMKSTGAHNIVHDDDTMRAALALCGLGRG